MNLEYFAHEIAESIQEERFQEAQTAHLLIEIRVKRPRLRQRIGEALVSAGTWLLGGAMVNSAAMTLCPEGQPCG
jgi:hypothetical protein